MFFLLGHRLLPDFRHGGFGFGANDPVGGSSGAAELVHRLFAGNEPGLGQQAP
ncbi:MAG: hypothetical protein J0H86_08890 [Xanthomonadaceae bacterium]|nr:hypothetical protein [Xanthomonadaceae bacterium]